MKVRALFPFNDMETGLLRQEGDEFVVSKERYEYLKSRSAVVLVEEEKVVEEKPKKSKKKKDEE